MSEQNYKYISPSEKSSLYSNLFQDLKPYVENWDYELNCKILEIMTNIDRKKLNSSMLPKQKINISSTKDVEDIRKILLAQKYNDTRGRWKYQPALEILVLFFGNWDSGSIKKNEEICMTLCKNALECFMKKKDIDVVFNWISEHEYKYSSFSDSF